MPRTSSRPALHYTVEGDGPPVILAHALGCTSGMWEGVAGTLVPRYLVIRYDVRCHGASESVSTPFAMAALVDDAVRLLDELRLPSVSLVGVSMGAMIGQGLAITHAPRIRSLVLANTTSRYPAAAQALWAARLQALREGGMAAVADAAVERLFSAGFAAANPGVVADYRDRLLRIAAVAYARCCEAVAGVDYHGRLREIHAPTLVIAGGADVAAPVAMAAEMAGLIPAARLAVLDGAGHLSCVEQPADFAGLVLSFLDSSR